MVHLCAGCKDLSDGKQSCRKKVWTFATNGGWLGHTLEDVKKICAGAEVKEGLNIQFNGQKMKTPAEQVRSWASKIAED